jgi:hypothetical protein
MNLPNKVMDVSSRIRTASQAGSAEVHGWGSAVASRSARHALLVTSKLMPGDARSPVSCCATLRCQVKLGNLTAHALNLTMA